MNRRALPLLRMLTILIGMVFSFPAARLEAQSVNVYWPFTNFVSQPATISSVTINPLCAGWNNQGTILIPQTIFFTRANTPGMLTNGTVATNLLAGFGYQVVFANGGYPIVTITNYFGTNLVGLTVNGANYQAANLSYPCPFTPAYLSTIVSNLTYSTTVNGATNVVGTNVPAAVIANGTLFYPTNYDAPGSASNALAVATNTFELLGAALTNFLSGSNYTWQTAAGLTNLNSTTSNGLAGFSSALSNYVQAVSNLMLFSKQPGNLNLTNLATVSTNQWATWTGVSNAFTYQSATLAYFLTGSNYSYNLAAGLTNLNSTTSNGLALYSAILSNYVQAVSNLLIFNKQPANNNLTNLASVTTNQWATWTGVSNAFSYQSASLAQFLTGSNYSYTLAAGLTNLNSTTSNGLAVYSLNLSNLLSAVSNLFLFSKQPGNNNLTNLATVSTNQWATWSGLTNYTSSNGIGISFFLTGSNYSYTLAAGLTNLNSTTSNGLAGFSSALSNYVQAVSNLLIFNKQPANNNLTNLATVSTNQWATWTGVSNLYETQPAAVASFQTASNYSYNLAAGLTNLNSTTSNGLQNYSFNVSNLLSAVSNLFLFTKQPGNNNLTNLATVTTNQWATWTGISNAFTYQAASLAYFLTSSNYSYTLASGLTNLNSTTSNGLALYSASLSNFVQAVSNLMLFAKQPANLNLTNLATVSTNQWATWTGVTNGFEQQIGALNFFLTGSNYTYNLSSISSNNLAIASALLTLGILNNVTNIVITSNGLVSLFGNINSNYVASTNGVAHSLTIADALLIGTKTNILLTTNNIGVVGNNGGTYVTIPFATVWTNFANPNEWILGSGSFYFLQTNAATNVETLYQFGPALGAGVVINGDFPAPTASWGANYGFDGNVLKGWVDSTNLTFQISNAAAIASQFVANNYVKAGYGLVQTNSAGTNILSVNTNGVIASIPYVQAAIAGLGSPTNGISGTQATNIIESLGPQLFYPLNFPMITNFLYTNVQALAPQELPIGTAWIYTNAGGGGGGGVTVFGFTNAFATNVPGVITTPPGSLFISTNYASVLFVNQAIPNFANNIGLGGVLGGVPTNANFSAAGTNGILAMLPLSTQFIQVTNGTGVGTTISNGNFAGVSNLSVFNESYLNQSNLDIYAQLNGQFSPVNGQWGLIPLMTATNVPAGYNAFDTLASANAYQAFTTNANWPNGESSASYTISLTFPNPVTVATAVAHIKLNVVSSGTQFEVTLQSSTNGSTWTTLAQPFVTGLTPSTSFFDFTNSISPAVTAQYYQWIYTSSASSGLPAVFGNGSPTNGPSLQLYGASWPNTTNINYLNSGGSQLNVLAPQGMGINTPATTLADLTLNGGLVAGGGFQAANMVTPGDVSASQYLLNGKIINFNTNQLSTITEVTIGGVITNGLASTFYTFTNINGNYFLQMASGTWTNSNGHGSSIYPFGISGSQTTWNIATNANQGLPPLWTRAGGVTSGDVIGSYVPFGGATSRYGITYNLLVSVAGLSTNALLPGTTLTSTNGSATLAISTNANQTLNYDITGTSGGGSSVFYIANQGASLPIATRPAITYDQLGGMFIKTNATTDAGGWIQIISDQ